jgi:hypothetical protein
MYGEVSFKSTNKELNYSPYDLHLSIDYSDKSSKLVFILKKCNQNANYVY